MPSVETCADKNSFFPATPISLQVLVNVLAPVSAKWSEMGTEFGFIRNDLEVIKQTKPHGPVIGWLTDMLDMKMNRSPDFGWSDVIQALVKIDCGTLADSIQQQHCPQGEERATYTRVLVIELDIYAECRSH